jgi:hypothetical protein
MFGFSTNTPKRGICESEGCETRLLFFKKSTQYFVCTIYTKKNKCAGWHGKTRGAIVFTLIFLCYFLCIKTKKVNRGRAQRQSAILMGSKVEETLQSTCCSLHAQPQAAPVKPSEEMV